MHIANAFVSSVYIYICCDDGIKFDYCKFHYVSLLDITGNHITTLKLHKASGYMVDMVILEQSADAGGKPARSTARCLSSSKSHDKCPIK